MITVEKYKTQRFGFLHLIQGGRIENEDGFLVLQRGGNVKTGDVGRTILQPTCRIELSKMVLAGVTPTSWRLSAYIYEGDRLVAIVDEAPGVCWPTLEKAVASMVGPGVPHTVRLYEVKPLETAPHPTPMSAGDSYSPAIHGKIDA